MKKIIFFAVFLVLSTFVHAQFIDNFGIRMGAGIANQNHTFTGQFSNLSGWEREKLGGNLYFFVEKKLNNFLSLRPEVGYSNKGFLSDFRFVDENGNLIGKEVSNYITHNFSSNIVLKISPLKNNPKPYFLVGLRGDYTLYASSKIEFDDMVFEVYGEQIKNARKFNLSPLFGLGYQLNEIFNIEFEYNPGLFKNYEGPTYSVKDRYLGLSIGAILNPNNSKNS